MMSMVHLFKVGIVALTSRQCKTCVLAAFLGLVTRYILVMIGWIEIHGLTILRQLPFFVITSNEAHDGI